MKPRRVREKWQRIATKLSQSTIDSEKITGADLAVTITSVRAAVVKPKRGKPRRRK